MSSLPAVDPRSMRQIDDKLSRLRLSRVVADVLVSETPPPQDREARTAPPQVRVPG